MTIKEVAKIAGVSPAAVSRFLNGGSVSEEKRERIRAVIDATGYHPDPMAQVMRTGRGGQIGVIVPKVNSDSASGILAGIHERLVDRNYDVVLGISDGNNKREVRCIESMQNNQVAGIILMGTVMTPDLRAAIDASEKPVVITGQNFDGFSCVYHDDYEAVRDLTGRMIRKGRRHIAYLGATEADEAAGKARRKGAEDACREAAEGTGEKGAHGSNGRNRRPEPSEERPGLIRVVADGFGPEDGFTAMKQLLAKYPDLDGVICATDRLAVGALKAIRASGRSVPEDIGVAGVGDSWVDPVTDPPLATVHLYYEQCGRAAAAMLLEQIESEGEAVPRQLKLEYTIIERESL